MTDTTTRRSVKLPLVLLLTGMALLMMGAAHPVQAASVTGLTSTLVKGGTSSNDQVAFSCSTSWDTQATPHGQATWMIVENIQYYNINGKEGAPVTVYIAGGTSSSPAATYTAGALPPGYFNAIQDAPTDAIGGSWNYTITVSVADTVSGATYASASTTTASQGYGVTTGTPGNGGGGNPQ